MQRLVGGLGVVLILLGEILHEAAHVHFEHVGVRVIGRLAQRGKGRIDRDVGHRVGVDV